MPGKNVRALAIMIRGDSDSYPGGPSIDELEAAGAPPDLLLIARAAAAGNPVHLGQWEISPGTLTAAVDYLEDNDLADEIDDVHAAILSRNSGGQTLVATFDEGDQECSIYLTDPEHAECRMLDRLEPWLAGVAEGDDQVSRLLLDTSEEVRRLRHLAADLPDQPDEGERLWIDGSARR